MGAEQFVREWTGQTVLHPLGLAAVIVFGALLLFLPRRYALFPMIAMACFIAPAQRIVLLTLDFDLLRIMVVFGWIRVIMRKEHRNFKWVTMDKLFIPYAIIGIITYSLLRGTLTSFVSRLGHMFDAVGMYFLFRLLINDFSDINKVIQGFILVSIPVALAFLIEKSTGRNVFSVFGGVPSITAIRGGRLRCQGAFAHPILAGCFWASLLPLISTRLWDRNFNKLITIIGILDCIIIIFACSSSTPVMAMMFGILGAFMFPFRNRMRIVRWGIILLLICLQIYMKSPIWSLIHRLDFVGGTGWHRYYLIDQAIKHFNEWWFLGATSTGHWGWGLFDVTNQYIMEGVRGGIITLLLFIFILVFGYKYVGKIIKKYSDSKEKVIFAWGLGVSLFIHTMVFISVSYFGQIIMVWFLTLAMCSSLQANLERDSSLVGKKS